MPRKFAILALVLVAVAVAGVAAAANRRPAGTTPPPPAALYVDPSGAAIAQLRALERAGRATEAALVRRIALQPAATWFADDATGYADRARRLVAAAAAARRIPVLTFYFIPHRDCGRYSAGGAPNGLAYRRWIGNLAGALHGHRAIVILEPDAVAHAVRGCLDRARAAERFALLAAAVETLRAVPGVQVYLDAGNPSWLRSEEAVAALRRAGIARARGFALNVANFETTAANIAYGIRLSRPLGGARFVVDTSRNGNGPARPGAGDRHWCNPPGRKLGVPPTLHTGHPLVDAYLWVKRPGESDGACSPGAPLAGRWFHRYALDLAR